MRSELGKECRKLFRKMMAVEFPDYKEDKGQIIPPRKYVWTRQHPCGIWLHILFMINPTRDTFTTEAAWDFDGKLPRFSHGGTDGILQSPVSFRVNFLWSGEDYWWRLVLRPEEFERAILYKEDPIEQCLPLIAPAVWEAGEKLKEHLIPAFEEIVRKHGSTQTKTI
jgi:hypothetical protein